MMFSCPKVRVDGRAIWVHPQFFLLPSPYPIHPPTSKIPTPRLSKFGFVNDYIEIIIEAYARIAILITMRNSLLPILHYTIR